MNYFYGSPEITEHAVKYTFRVAQSLERSSRPTAVEIAIELYIITSGRNVSRVNERLGVISATSLYRIAEINEARLGDKDKAKRTYREILAQYENSSNPEIMLIVNLAKQKIETLMQ